MTPTSILFVCTGNICRSPMAESIFKKLIELDGCNEKFHLDSAGTMGYHQGELADERMRHHANVRGYNITHRSRPVVKSDFENFDMIIGMDEENMSLLRLKAPSDFYASKIFKMTDFCNKYDNTYVPDPYYGGDKGFQTVIDILEDACTGLLMHLKQNK